MNINKSCFRWNLAYCEVHELLWLFALTNSRFWDSWFGLFMTKWWYLLLDLCFIKGTSDISTWPIANRLTFPLWLQTTLPTLWFMNNHAKGFSNKSDYFILPEIIPYLDICVDILRSLYLGDNWPRHKRVSFVLLSCSHSVYTFWSLKDAFAYKLVLERWLLTTLVLGS